MRKRSVKVARDSLEDMLRRIHPYLPVTPKEEPEEEAAWKLVDPRVIPIVTAKENKNTA